MRRIVNSWAAAMASAVTGRAVTKLAAVSRLDVAKGWRAGCRRRASGVGEVARWPGSVAAAAVLVGALAAPASAPGQGWSITPSPNPRVPTGQLFWVSCPAADSCMAVGTYVKTSGEGVNLAEQWNGTSWRILPTPNPAGTALSGLLGVACTSSSACTAVGASITTAGVPRAVAERWNGIRWTIQTTPNPPQGHGFLSGVACPSASSCTAVGASNAFTPNARTLAERWNGTRWTIQATPNPPQGGGGLNGVSCTSASACMAVGDSDAGTLAERWNGASWRIQPTPTPAGAQFAFLNTVACTSSSACTAAGAYINSSGIFKTLAERWNGASWQRQATPNQGPSFLIGVACTSAAACAAVGYSNTNQSPAVLVERSAGTTWRTEAAPNPGGAASSSLSGVACASHSACVAVGATTSRTRNVATLAERWNGHTWSIQSTPSPAGGGALSSVSCTSASACAAVGGRADGRTLAERRNGARWRIQATPNPAGGGFLNSVSCASPSACTAVGNSGNGRTLAERWNGTRWTIQATPNPAGPASTLGSVACPTSSACMAVGLRFDNSGNPVGTLAEAWNGRTWRIVATFQRTGQGIALNGVSCTSPSACTAVGSSGPATTLAERWNGTRWRVQLTPNPPGGGNIFLTSVACPTSSACTAFGLNLTGSGPLALAERWNGRTWRIQPTPGLVTFDIGTPGVACPTSSACFAVASYANNGPNLTLAERWNRATSASQPASSRLAAPPAALVRACAYFPLTMAASARRLSHAEPWNWSFAQGHFNRASPTGLGTLGGCPPL